MKNLRIISLLFLLAITALLSAQPAERPLQVVVGADHSDMLYDTGQNIKFTVSVFKNGNLVENAEIRYEISEDMMQPHKSENMVLKDGTAVINAGAMKKPGFLRCRVVAKHNGREYASVATAGVSPQKIEPVTQLPDDFTEFWEQAKAKAAKVSMDIKMTLVPERCTGKVNVYHVSLQSFEDGNRLYGMLCVPRGEGKYPAILKVPGAGIRAYGGDIESASRGYIVFEIGIHGIPVNLPGDVYANLYAGALKGYHTFNMDNRDKYYYKRVYLGCVRAIDFIYTLPEFDRQNLISYGGSQGGALAIVTAALDSRVKGLVAFYPALCDLTGYLHGRAGGWPHMFRQEVNNTPAKIKTAQYYDVVNFARQINVPGFYSFGYNDMVCPPTTMYAAFNAIGAPKEFCIMENTAHYAYPEQRSESWKWVKEFFGK
ncbi:acetylxylan esterase [Dysgonomonas sp. 511]|uniref:acetylxylan esterase n=1 Tax=Dysgonomonas sp. 511 TaxID=2302930 RepID=UPI0013D843FB|nr:acetylxylan esterase [Dysgonomonas sp. 511]NDV79177.1 acetylxylan esterase [Dysgonomonas sp. 511]